MIRNPVAEALAIAKHGSLRHHGPGRTDDLEINVPGESFVIPADIVSALGQGNTEAGFAALESYFPPIKEERAGGGGVPIVAAGGEFVVHPSHVARVGGGDVKKGHEALRDFVTLMRKKTIKQLKKLPKPVRG
jgi:hypothetical protein